MKSGIYLAVSIFGVSTKVLECTVTVVLLSECYQSVMPSAEVWMCTSPVCASCADQMKKLKEKATVTVAKKSTKSTGVFTSLFKGAMRLCEVSKYGFLNVTLQLFSFRGQQFMKSLLSVTK